MQNQEKNSEQKVKNQKQRLFDPNSLDHIIKNKDDYYEPEEIHHLDKNNLDHLIAANPNSTNVIKKKITKRLTMLQVDMVKNQILDNVFRKKSLKMPTDHKFHREGGELIDDVALKKEHNQLLITHWSVEKIIASGGVKSINQLDISHYQFDYSSFEGMENLRFLNISNNNLGPIIDSVVGHMTHLKFLKYLNISSNNITSINVGIEESLISVIYFNDNLIDHAAYISPFLNTLKSLMLVIMEDNPLTRQPNWRQSIVQANFHIKCIDSYIVSDEERYPVSPIFFENNKYQSLSDRMKFNDRITSNVPRFLAINQMNMVGLENQHYKLMYIDKEFLVKGDQVEQNAVIDETLIKFYDQSMLKLRNIAWKKSPIQLIQSLVRKQVTKKRFNKWKDKVKIAVLLIQKNWRKFKIQRDIKVENKKHYNQLWRKHILNEWFKIPFNLEILKNVQNKYKMIVKILKRAREAHRLYLKMLNLWRFNRIKINEIYNLQNLDKYPKLQIQKSQVHIQREILSAAFPVKQGENVFECKNQTTFKLPDIDNIKYSDSLLINMQKWMNSENFIIKKFNFQDVPSQTSFRQMLLTKDFTRKNHHTVNRLQRRNNIRTNVIRSLIPDNRFHDDNQFEMSYFQFKHRWQYSVFFNWVGLYNKTKYEELLNITYQIYLNKKKLNDQSKIDIIHLEVDENDKDVRKAKGLFNINQKEEAHRDKLEWTQPKLLERNILGSKFMAIADTQDFKAFKAQNQVMFWPEQSVRVVSAVVTIQSCWRRYRSNLMLGFDVLEEITKRRAVYIIRKAHFTSKFNKRLEILTTLKKYIDWIKTNIPKFNPTKKDKRKNQDLIIDEYSFSKLVSMKPEQIQRNIIFAEQKFLIGIVPNSNSWFQFIPYFYMNKIRESRSVIPDWIDLRMNNVACLSNEDGHLESLWKDPILKAKRMFKRMSTITKIDEKNRGPILNELINPTPKPVVTSPSVDKDNPDNLKVIIDDSKLNPTIVTRDLKHLYGFSDKYLVPNLAMPSFRQIIFKKNPVLMRCENLQEGMGNQTRIVKIPIDSYDEMVSVIILFMMWSWRNHKCIKIAPERLLDFKGPTGWLIEDVVLKNNLQYWELEEYPVQKDMASQNIYADTVHFPSVTLSDNNFTHKLLGESHVVYGKAKEQSLKKQQQLIPLKRTWNMERKENDRIKQEQMLEVYTRKKDIAAKVKQANLLDDKNPVNHQNMDGLMQKLEVEDQVRHLKSDYQVNLHKSKILAELEHNKELIQQVSESRRNAQLAFQEQKEVKKMDVLKEKEHRRKQMQELQNKELEHVQNLVSQRDHQRVQKSIASQKDSNYSICKNFGNKINKLTRIFKSENQDENQKHQQAEAREKVERLKTISKKRAFESKMFLSQEISRKREECQRMKLALDQSQQQAKLKQKTKYDSQMQMVRKVPDQQLSFLESKYTGRHAQKSVDNTRQKNYDFEEMVQDSFGDNSQFKIKFHQLKSEDKETNQRKPIQLKGNKNLQGNGNNNSERIGLKTTGDIDKLNQVDVNDNLHKGNKSTKGYSGHIEKLSLSDGDINLMGNENQSEVKVDMTYRKVDQTQESMNQSLGLKSTNLMSGESEEKNWSVSDTNNLMEPSRYNNINDIEDINEEDELDQDGLGDNSEDK